MKSSPGAMVRRFALSLPETAERDHMGAPSFRVRGKIFAQLSADEHVALVKLSLEEQDELVHEHPDRFWVPDHWSKFGWTYVRIEGTAAEHLRALLEGSWRRVAPKALAATLLP